MPEPATMEPPQKVPDINSIFAEIEAQKSDFQTKIADLKFEDGKAKAIAPVEPKPEPKPPTEKKAEVPKEPAPKKDIADPPSDALPHIEDDIPEILPEGTDSKKQSQWKQLQTRKKEAERLVAEYQTKLKEAENKLQTIVKPTPETESQLLELQKQRDHLSSILEAVAAERHPKFQQQFQGRTEAALSLAQQAVGPELADKVAQLIQMPDNEFRNSQLDDIISSLGHLRAGKLTNAIGDMDRISIEKQSLSARGQEQWKAWTSENVEKQRQQQAQQQAQTEKAFTSELEQWTQKAQLFQPKANDSEWNSALESRVARAKQIFMGGMDERSLARAAFWAAMGQDIVGMSKATEDRCKALEQENAALKSASPGSQAASPKTDDVDDTQHKSYGDKIAAELARAGIRFGS